MADEQPPQVPLQPPAVPPATPPGADFSAPAGPPPYAPQPAEGWRDAYDKERKKFHIASAAAAVAAVVAVVALVWGVAQNQASSTVAGGQFSGAGQMPGYGPGADGAQGGMGGPGMGGPGRIQEQLLNDDGTVNSTAVAELKAQSEAGQGPPLEMLAQILPREVQRGDLTQAQADQILAALGLSAASANPSATASSSANASAGT
ncbi:MAG: hypothetical protein ACH36H_11510 [Candidatus Nanopelagicales bacterium]